MPVPLNLDELKERTLEQIAALKEKKVKISGEMINQYLLEKNLTGPSHRNIRSMLPSCSLVNKFKGKKQPHYDNISVLLALNVFVGEHRRMLARTRLADEDYCTPHRITDRIKHIIDKFLGESDRDVRVQLRAATAAAAAGSDGDGDGDGDGGGGGGGDGGGGDGGGEGGGGEGGGEGGGGDGGGEGDGGEDGGQANALQEP